MKKVLYILFHRSVVVGLSLLAQGVTLIVMVSVFSGYTQTPGGFQEVTLWSDGTGWPPIAPLGWPC